jgi:proline iminopeptidase
VADSGTVDRDGFQLEWVREGHGIPMMVLGSQRFYRRYYPQALREHFEIVFCDLRQWAPTPDGFDIRTITRDTFSEDVDAIREATGLDRPIVAGQSQHGSVALAYACHSPEQVRGVVAIAANPPAGSWDGVESTEDFFLRDASAERVAAHEQNHATRRVLEPMETSQDFIHNYVANGAYFWYDPTFDCSPLWEGVEVNLPVMHQLFKPEGLGGYQVDGLEVPVFLALGRYDYGTPFYAWDKARKTLPNLRYELYDKSAHQPPYEQPDEFTADLLDWAKAL